MSGQRNRSLSMESPIYTVPELTTIVRVVRDHVPIKVKFSFIYESIAEMALFSISRPVRLSNYFHIRCKYSRRTLTLAISEDIHSAGSLIFMNFDLTGACLSSQVLDIIGNFFSSWLPLPYLKVVYYPLSDYMESPCCGCHAMNHQCCTVVP